MPSPRSRKNRQQNQQRQRIGHHYWFCTSPWSPRSRPIPFHRDKDHQLATPVSWSVKKKSPEQYKKDRAGQYASYFQGNTIVPISELMTAVEPKFFIVTNLRTRRLEEFFLKDTFEELPKPTGILCRYYCLQSIPTKDILLLSEELALKLAGTRIQMNKDNHSDRVQRPKTIRDVLAAYLSAYGSVEVTSDRSVDWTAHGGYILSICLNREGFQAIPHIKSYKDQSMMVVVKQEAALLVL